MKKSILLFSALSCFFAACQQKTSEQKIDSLATSPDTAITATKTCYSYIYKKDTISLSFTKAGNAVAGELLYNLFEKDKNSGTIAGTIQGDTIIADYTFNSEGRSSVRQVAFLRKGDQLLEGYGPVTEKDDKMVFTDLKGLKYMDAITLKEIPCK